MESLIIRIPIILIAFCAGNVCGVAALLLAAYAISRRKRGSKSGEL